MTEHPILFSADMVRAILDGRKTQTRRVIVPQPDDVDPEPRFEPYTWAFWHDEHYPNGRIMRSPYGKPGDLLWVKEGLEQEFTTADADTPNGCLALYRRDQEVVKRDGRPAMYEWSRETLSPIHMPKWAARLWLEITDVRVQRVQEISEEDAWAEGIGGIVEAASRSGLMGVLKNSNVALAGKARNPGLKPPGRYYFACLWDSINAKRGYSWADNPFVWAVTFKTLSSTGKPATAAESR